jgi:hypothetical protein
MWTADEYLKLPSYRLNSTFFAKLAIWAKLVVIEVT